MKTGDRIIVYWGRFGQVNCVIEKVSKSGKIYAKRWNKKRNCWTNSRIVKPYKGIYRIF